MEQNSELFCADSGAERRFARAYAARRAQMDFQLIGGQPTSLRWADRAQAIG